MNSIVMEALVRNVIVHRRLPFTFISVVASSAGWQVQVRGGGGEAVSFAVPSGRPVLMRAAIQTSLEAVIEDAAGSQART